MLACTVLNFFAGGTFFYGFTVYFTPIRDAFGWTAAMTSVAFGFRGLEQSVLTPIAGLMVDRVGPRKLLIPGWITAGLGFILMGRIESLWAFYATFVVIAVGMSFGQFVVVNTAIANWFEKKRSRAITLVYVGFGASGLLAPLLSWTVEQFTWRNSLAMVGISFLVICVPLCALVRRRPEDYGYRPDGETAPSGNHCAGGSPDHRPRSRWRSTSRRARRSAPLVSGSFLWCSCSSTSLPAR